MKNYLKIVMAHAVLVASVDVSGMLRGFGAPGEESTGGVDVSKLNARIGLEMVGVTGVVPIKYNLDGSVITLATPAMSAGVNRLHIELTYGTNATSILDVDLFVPQGVDGQETHVITMQVVETLGGTGGGGGGMQQYILGYSDGHITHDGTPLTFAEVKAAVEDTTKFVYLNHANALHLPCFIVDSEGNSAVAFSAAFQVSGAPFIERVAINEQEEVKIDNMRCVHFNDNDGVAIGFDTNAEGQYSHAEGGISNAIGIAAHAEGVGSNAIGNGSHAEGGENTASSEYSHAEGTGTTASGESSHAEGWETTASGYGSHAEGGETTASGECSHADGMYSNSDDFGEDEPGAYMHGCGTGDDDRKNAFAIAADGSIYVIGLGGYDGTNHTEALSLQELFATSNIKVSRNVTKNGYQVPDLTVEQVTQAYNAVVAGRSVTITDATENFHLAVTQADVINGGYAISLIYLNALLLTYEVTGNSVTIEAKTL